MVILRGDLFDFKFVDGDLFWLIFWVMYRVFGRGFWGLSGWKGGFVVV